VPKISTQALSKVLGRHTRLGVPFSWTIGGTLVNLEDDGYTVRVFVQDVDGITVAGPFPTTVSGTTATYTMSTTDLDGASPSDTDYVVLVAVAENGTNTLVSDGRAITVGEWGGADDYEPLS